MLPRLNTSNLSLAIIPVSYSLKTLKFTRDYLCLSVDYLLGLEFPFGTENDILKRCKTIHPQSRLSTSKMKHKSPAKLLRSVKRITKFIERKKTVRQSPDNAHETPLSAPKDIPKITLADFQSLLRIENKKREDQRRQERIVMEEERRLERAEDLRKLQVLLGLPP